MTAAQPVQFISEEPQPLLRTVLKGQKYPVSDLGPLRAAVQAVHDKTQAPVEIAAQSALSVASLAVQGIADVETLAGWSPCSLFSLTIAQSGERKSACDKLLMQGVRDFEAEREVGYGKKITRYQTALKLWELRRNRLLKDAAGSGDKARQAQADLEALSPPPEPPLRPILTASEPTFPGLVKLFQVGRPSLGLFTDEAGAFVGGYSMNSDNKLATVSGLSSLWDGSPINRTRVEDGATTIRGKRLAAHLMAQPIAVLPMLADPIVSQQGFLARFLISWPESAIGHRTRRGFAPSSDAAISEFCSRLRACLEHYLPIREGTRNTLRPRRLSLSEGARELLTRYYETTEREQADSGDLAHVRAYASKTAEQAARIAGVLTLWEDAQANNIRTDVMANGISLAQYYLSEASRLVDTAEVSVEIERAEKLRVWLLEKWPEHDILPRDIVQKGPNILRDIKIATAAISILVQYGWLIPFAEGTLIRGRNRIKAYRIVRPAHVV